jgi:hypothetical protein
MTDSVGKALTSDYISLHILRDHGVWTTGLDTTLLSTLSRLTIIVMAMLLILTIRRLCNTATGMDTAHATRGNAEAYLRL